MSIVLAELMRTVARNAQQTDALQAWWFRAAVMTGAIALLLRQVVHANAADVDMFHEMALIREALALGFFPLTDLWAYTPTVSPVVHHEWGTGAVLYGLVVATGWGWGAVKLLQFALLAGIAAAAYRATRNRGAHPLMAALLVGLAAALLSPGLAPVRAQMFTYLFTAVLLLLLPAHERLRGRLLLIWLPLFALWVNMHGGFVVGLGLFGLYTAESLVRDRLSAGNWTSALSRNRYLLAALPAMALLVLATPYGIHYPGYVWSAIHLDRAMIAEWAPIWDPRVQAPLVVAFAVSLLVPLYAILRSDRRHNQTGLSLLLAAALATILSQRMVPLYAIVWFCSIPGWLAHTPLQPLVIRLATRFRVAVAAAAIAVTIITAAALVRERSWELRFPAEPDGAAVYYPVGAVSYLRQTGFEGNVMTPYNVGAYVSWMLYPRVLVSLDSRYEVAYPTDQVEELETFYLASPGWEGTLDRYPPDAILAPVLSPVSQLLNNEPYRLEWREVYRDAGHMLFIRLAGYSGTGNDVR